MSSFLLKNYRSVWIIFLFLFVFNHQSKPQEVSGTILQDKIDQLSKKIEHKVISWRRDFHQHPELSNREFRTSRIVAEHLRKLGMEVKTEVAHTGVIGILRGKNETVVVALRADMDALPVTEALELPFSSKVKTTYNGKPDGSPVTINDPLLTERMIPVLKKVVGKNNVASIHPKTVAEDFSYYQQKIPGMFFFLGTAPKDADLTKVAQNHSPYFYVDETGLIIGVRALSQLAVEFLANN